MSSDLLHESETVELKKSLAELKEGLVSIAAILNKHRAGELWFGVASNGKVVGFEITEKTLRDVSQAIGAHIEPRIYPQIESVSQSGKPCLRIRFEGQETPYFAHGRAYIRVADEDRQLSVKELEKYILSKHRDALRWDNQPTELALADLNTTKVQKFARKAGMVWGSLGETPGTQLQQALNKLELLHKGHPVNAARLFFAKKPPIQLRCAVFASTTSATIIDRHDYDGDILELIEEAQKFILKNIHIGMRIEGLYRVDVPEVSMEALREAIINAFCHRDWRSPDYVQAAIFKDRVEIRSPGLLFGDVTIEAIRRGNVSSRRNPLIADLFRRIEMVEGWGRGMPLMLENAPTVEFREFAGLFIASFERPSFLVGGNMGTAQETTQETTQETVEKAKGKAFELLNLLKQQPNTSRKQLAAQTGLTEDGVKYHLNKLKASGRIRHIGPTKTGRWEVLAPGDSAEAGRAGV